MTRRLLNSTGFLVVGAAFLLTPAYATPVNFSTTGSFSESGSNIFSSSDGSGDSLTVTYTAVTNGVSNPSPVSAINLGTFTVATTGTGGALGGNFTLTINQTVPPSPSQPLASDTLSGTIVATNSGFAVVSFSPQGSAAADTNPLDLNDALSFNLGGVEYYVDEFTNLNPPSTNQGVSTINGALETPEPTFYSITAVGFLGLLALAVRRRKQQSMT